MRKLKFRYGSCRNLPVQLLQPGGGGAYPKWFINFLTGRCARDAKLDRLARKLLEALTDGKWHARIPDGVGAWTVEACFDLGLVARKLTSVEKTGENPRSAATFKITTSGRKALIKDRIP